MNFVICKQLEYINKLICVCLQLKPYVSYRAPDITQSEFTSKDLFDFIYSPKIIEDFHAKKLDPNGNPIEPSPEEELSPETTWNNARKTGTDIF